MPVRSSGRMLQAEMSQDVVQGFSEATGDGSLTALLCLGSPVGFCGVPKCSVVFGSVRFPRPRTGALDFYDGVRQRIVCDFPAGSCQCGPTLTHLGKGFVWMLQP